MGIWRCCGEYVGFEKVEFSCCGGGRETESDTVSYHNSSMVSGFPSRRDSSRGIFELLESWKRLCRDHNSIPEMPRQRSIVSYTLVRW